jgi:DNA primase
MMTGTLLDDIKSKIDIVDLISGYVQLKKSGQNWKGLCPFHSEKTPSFMVSQSKQIFHCFGCGAGGDIIAFVGKYENLSFNESVKMLATKAGVSVTHIMKTDQKALQKDEKIRSALLTASLYFVKQLHGSVAATEYVRNRGISEESLDIFKIGYAPSGWHNLLKYLRNTGYTDQVIREAGLAVQGERGLYDMFRARVIFPIMSAGGNVLAFGGRALDDSMPKYINSPETAVFKKSDTLFGLYTAKEEIRKRSSVIIVEGYMDAIICHQYGFKNVVAPLGTSLTSGHIQKLRSLANKAVLVFDGDAAGKAAAKRALLLFCQNNYEASVLLLPEKDDPDSFLRKHGEMAFSKALEVSKTMIDFLFSVSIGEKIDTVREALSLIAAVGDPLIAGGMLIELSDRTRINEMTIREEFRKIKNKKAANSPDAGLTGPPLKNGEEYLLLSAVIAFPEKFSYVISRLDPSEIKDKTVSALLKKLESLEDKKDLAVMLAHADEDERRIITKLSVDPGFDLDHVDRNIEDCFRRIEQRNLDEGIRLAETAGDLSLVNALVLKKKKNMKETGL